MAFQEEYIPFKPHLAFQSSDEDIVLPAKQRLSVLDYIDEDFISDPAFED